MDQSKSRDAEEAENLNRRLEIGKAVNPDPEGRTFEA
jgi:hypothetical protein